jgi:hypothetical protein
MQWIEKRGSLHESDGSGGRCFARDGITAKNKHDKEEID